MSFEYDFEKVLNLCRSGSAPPTVEGSLSAVCALFGQGKNGSGIFEESFRSDPAYTSYYFKNFHLNPRLPPPLLSREDWRSSQRLKGGNSVLGGIGDRRKISRTSMPPGFNLHKEESDHSDKTPTEWISDGLIGLSGLDLGAKQRSLSQKFQNELGHASPVSEHHFRPSSHNAFDENIENIGSAEVQLLNLCQNSSVVPDIGKSTSCSYAAALASSLSRSNSPDPQFISRAPSPCLTPIGGERASVSESRGVKSPNLFPGFYVGTSESADLAEALSGMNISVKGMMDEEDQLSSHINDVDVHQSYLFNSQDGHSHLNSSEHGHIQTPYSQRTNSYYPDLSKTNRAEMEKPHTHSLNHLSKRSPASMLTGGGLHSQYQHIDSTNPLYINYCANEYNNNPSLTSMMSNNMPPLYENMAVGSALLGMDSRVMAGGFGSRSNLIADISQLQTFSRMGNQFVGNALQVPYEDSMYLQHLRTLEYAAAQSLSVNDPSSQDLQGLQKAYLGSLIPPQKSQYGKFSGSDHHSLYGNFSYGIDMSYPGSLLTNPSIANSRGRHNKVNLCSPSGMRSFSGGIMGPLNFEGNVDDGFPMSLIEEFKSNKARCFELSDIAGHVVEFSVDQYGSRFLQQKMETATIEEKNMVFQEIMPPILSLMTDVFGNYVIQKFFEHGAASQRRELANKLNSHVLSLSLQMYGCRVIQKAIEVVDVDQKIRMVEELDGHVMRCVRDQNGNHVIQKCIECVPEESIQFIVTTFFDQVVTLSVHPYGCRVMQRILEHCMDPQTQSKVMDEILGSISMLAQDQYGNYVVQHLLEHGKPHERSAIIKELAGNLVQMSQQKFASNVVEKCLTFAGPSERETLVNEVLGSTDENEPLQAMMKDQFANYVVQKVLETCDEQQRQHILSRIKVHLNALKKYTYGKHIVARIEKLVAAGERRVPVHSVSTLCMG